MVTATLVGCGGTQPLPNRALSALAVTAGGGSVLIDCGEGTQAACRRHGVNLFRLDAVLLTHYHGDHIFGLPGLWQTMAGMGRTQPLLMVGPPGLAKVLRAFLAVAGPLPFGLQALEMERCRGSFEAGAFTVEAFPLKHRVDCCGYALTLPRAGKFDPERAKAAGVPLAFWSRLQSGENVAGYTPDMVLGPPRRGLKIVYGADTRPCPALEQAARDADLLCMDATYADDADDAKAKLYGHATCRQAGELAAKANVRRLWLTHYSAAVTETGDETPGLGAARGAFPAAEGGFDGKQLELFFDPDPE